MDRRERGSTIEVEDDVRLSCSRSVPVRRRSAITWSIRSLGDCVKGRYLLEKYTSAWMLPHPGGAFFGFADGSVRFFRQSADPNTIKWLGCRNDGLVIQYDF